MIKEWVKKEFQTIDIGDKRLDERVLHLLTASSSQPQASLNKMFNTRKEVQACYRFFSNDLVTDSKIISPHINQTVKRAANYPVILNLSDTTSLNYTTRKKLKDSGYISSNNAQGFFLHASIAVTPDRLHLGVTDYTLWSREKEKPEKVLHRDYRDLNEKESNRWLEAYISSCKLAESCQDSQIVHITDREGDIFEIFYEYQEQKKKNNKAADFVIRSNHNRSTYAGEKKIYATKQLSKGSETLQIKILSKIINENLRSSKKLDKIDFIGTKKIFKSLHIELKKTKKISKTRFKERKKESDLLHNRIKKSKILAEINFEITKRDTNETRKVRQSVRASAITLKSGEGADEQEVQVNVIYLEEIDPPEGEKPVIWRLLTSLPIGTIEEILTIIKYYLCRWEIEVYFKTYKSGCKVEEKSLRSADRLYPLFCLFLIVAWRINYLLHMGRINPEISCEVFFEPSEWKSAYIAATRIRQYPKTPPTMKEMMGYVAKLGGYLGRENDPEPGPKVMWIGICKLSHYADAWDLFGPEANQNQ